MYDRDNDITRLFNEDSREKKRTAVGIHSRASRRGYIRGGIKTPSDFLTNKEKKKLSGEVKVYSMYESYKNLENCNLKEILKMDNNAIKNILTVIKENNTCSVICKGLNISNGKLYTLYRKYDVEFERKDKRPEYEKAVDPKKVLDVSKFNLLDSIQKGKYVSETIEKLNISLGMLAKHWGMNKNTLAYYSTRFKKINNKKLKVPQEEIVNEVALTATNEATQTQFPVLSEQEHNELVDLKKEIEEVRNENKKLVESLIAYSKDNSFKGLKININGEYNKKDLSDRLLSLDGIMMENRKYKVEFSLEELL